MANLIFSNILISGSGFMGTHIAYLITQKTLGKVIVYDSNQLSLEKSKATITDIGQKAIGKAKLLDSEFASMLSRLTFTNSIDSVSNCDLVIEAIFENLAIKQELFAALDKVMPNHCIFATNTSSLSVTQIAAKTKRTSQFIGMHFFSPAHIMKLIELIPGLDTSTETIAKIKDFSQQLGKEVVMANDFPGFITTRLGLVLINEAIYTLMEGISSKEEIDTAMKLGYNHPMGPLELADFIGLDVCLNILNRLYEGFSDSKYRPCPLLKNYVAANHLGRKTGSGFYDYSRST